MYDISDKFHLARSDLFGAAQLYDLDPDVRIFVVHMTDWYTPMDGAIHVFDTLPV